MTLEKNGIKTSAWVGSSQQKWRMVIQKTYNDMTNPYHAYYQAVYWAGGLGLLPQDSNTNFGVN